MDKMCIRSLTFSLAITWAIGVLFLGWVAIGGWGSYLVDVLGSFYIGYEASFFGAIIGAIWAFVDAAIAGFLIALFYNIFASKKKVRRKK